MKMNRRKKFRSAQDETMDSGNESRLPTERPYFFYSVGRKLQTGTVNR